MQEAMNYLLRKTRLILNFLPHKLPVGMPEFDIYCADLFDLYDLPDLPSYKQAIASMVMHLSPTTFYKSPRYFAVSVKKAMANQTAYEVIQQIKEQEKEKLNAAAAPKQDEAV